MISLCTFYIIVADSPRLLKYGWMLDLVVKTRRRYISTQKLMQDMDSETADALPGIHALTGSDYTSAFMGKGKVRSFNILIKIPRYRIFIGKLGDGNLVSEVLDI